MCLLILSLVRESWTWDSIELYTPKLVFSSLLIFNLLVIRYKIIHLLSSLFWQNFLATLKKKAAEQILKFPGSFNVNLINQCRTIGDFDDIFIAKIYGFKDKVANLNLAT